MSDGNVKYCVFSFKDGVFFKGKSTTPGVKTGDGGDVRSVSTCE